MLKPALLTSILHSRGTAVVLAAVAVLFFWLYYASGLTVHISGDKGVALPSANEWIAPGALDFAASIAAYGLSLFLMILICRIYNVLRSMTWLHVGLFSLMQAATPGLDVQIYTGSVMLPVVEVCVLLLLGTYRQPRASGPIFLIFCLLSFFAATQYCYIVYMLVFLMGCAQMQVFNGRTLVAALIGVVTPWWIMLGFGIITLADIHLPSFAGVFTLIDFSDTFMLLSTVGLTALLIVLSLVLNVFRTIAYNARARAVNGVFTVLSLVTLLACCVDYHNLISYIPLLNFCAALQVSHYFATHRAEKSCFAILPVMVAYIAIYICQRVI